MEILEIRSDTKLIKLKTDTKILHRANIFKILDRFSGLRIQDLADDRVKEIEIYDPYTYIVYNEQDIYENIKTKLKFKILIPEVKIPDKTDEYDITIIADSIKSYPDIYRIIRNRFKNPQLVNLEEESLPNKISSQKVLIVNSISSFLYPVAILDDYYLIDSGTHRYLQPYLKDRYIIYFEYSKWLNNNSTIKIDISEEIFKENNPYNLIKNFSRNEISKTIMNIITSNSLRDNTIGVRV